MSASSCYTSTAWKFSYRRFVRDTDLFALDLSIVSNLSLTHSVNNVRTVTLFWMKNPLTLINSPVLEPPHTLPPTIIWQSAVAWFKFSAWISIPVKPPLTIAKFSLTACASAQAVDASIVGSIFPHTHRLQQCLLNREISAYIHMYEFIWIYSSNTCFWSDSRYWECIPSIK